MASRLRWYGPEVLAVLNAAGSRGLKDGGDIVETEARDRTLVESSRLRDSYRRQSDGLSETIYNDDPKAAAAHENLQDTPRTPGTRAKFLESAATDRWDDVLDTVADHLRKVL